MKRIKKMMLVTLMATTAIAMSLMSTALAAPAIGSIAGLPAGTTVKNCPTSDLLKQYLGNAGNNMSADKLQQLINQYGISKPATGTLANGCTTTACQVAKSECSTNPAFCTLSGCKQSALTGKTCPKRQACTGSNCAKVPTTTTPAPKPAPVPAPQPPVINPPATGSMTSEESKMINLVNQERTNAGLNALVFDSTLRVPALKHSTDMSANNFFSHTSPTNGTFSERLKASGAKYTSAGENLAMYGSVEKAHVGLMNSPGHRANIMNTNYTRIGIGIVYNQSKGAYYITQWFAK